MATRLTHPYRHAVTALMLAGVVSVASAQTKVTPDNNKYTPAQDVQIGREAAAEVRRELPMLKDRQVDDAIARIGRKLVSGIPPEFRHNEFRYTFEVVNQSEINAFALPGGPMFLHRGMIEAARSEGEVAGVMAHEIAHVALRHGTAQATKAQKFQVGSIAGQVLGAIIGGTAGSVIAQGSNFGLGAYFLKYGREYEREADLLGAQIMARSGYDPRRMADMFRTIEEQGGGRGGPEWLSSHPNPGNRYEAIQREAAMLQIQGSASETDFNAIQARLRAMGPAYTAEQIARARASGGRLPTGGSRDEGTTRRPQNTRIEPPSTRQQTVQVGNVMRLAVPRNWQQVTGQDSVTFVPAGAQYSGQGGQSGFTHGLQIGVMTPRSASHQDATEELIEGVARANPQMRRQGRGYTRDSIGGRAALTTALRNVSQVTGNTELVTISTVPLRDGSLLYMIGVAPQEEAGTYEPVFRRVKDSAQLQDQASRNR
jgi:beta-barrel assembly-enhancing protease